MESPHFNPEALWIARKRQKLTITDAAKLLGKHRFTIHRIEAGTRTETGALAVKEETIRRYAELLGVDPNEVFQPECVA